MNRASIIAIGIGCGALLLYAPAPDTMTAFALGGFVGIVLGAVLGAAFVVGEKERP
jgi:hypothetical protein